MSGDASGGTQCRGAGGRARGILLANFERPTWFDREEKDLCSLRIDLPGQPARRKLANEMEPGLRLAAD